MLWSQIISLVSTAKVHHLNFCKIYHVSIYIYQCTFGINYLLTYLLTNIGNCFEIYSQIGVPFIKYLFDAFRHTECNCGKVLVVVFIKRELWMI